MCTSSKSSTLLHYKCVRLLEVVYFCVIKQIAGLLTITMTHVLTSVQKQKHLFLFYVLPSLD